MKKLLMAIFFILYISTNFVSAVVVSSGGAAAAVINAQRIREQQQFSDTVKGSGCSLPLEFAKNHSCQLEYPQYSDRRVGSFICRIDDYHYYNLLADCQGGVSSLNEVNLDNSLIVFDLKVFDLKGIFIFCAIFILLIIIRIVMAKRSENE